MIIGYCILILLIISYCILILLIITYCLLIHPGICILWCRTTMRPARLVSYVFLYTTCDSSGKLKCSQSSLECKRLEETIANVISIVAVVELSNISDFLS